MLVQHDTDEDLTCHLTPRRLNSFVHCEVFCPETVKLQWYGIVIDIMCKQHKRQPSKHVKSAHYRPASETPSKWRFAGGPIVARDLTLTGNAVAHLVEC